MKFLFLILCFSSGLFAGQPHKFKGKILSYNETHVKFLVDGKTRKFPMSGLSSDFKSILDKNLGKEVEVTSLIPLPDK